MIWSQQPSRAPVVLFIMFFSLTAKTTNTSPLTANIEGDQHAPLSSEIKQTPFQYAQTRNDQQVTPNEEEDELFKDIDPKTLAAVLLKAINKPQEQVISKEYKTGEINHKEEEEREIQEAESDRDGPRELELLLTTAQGRGEREDEDEDERKREKDEEERLTEKVTSHTTSQTVPVKVQDVVTKEVVNKEGQQESERGTDQDNEEQINSEELKNLETMLEEFQSYSTTTKRERDSSFGERESRGDYFDFLDRNGLMNNEIKPKPKGYDLAQSKMKLKWQQEQEKDKNRPLSKGGNFMDDFNDNLDDQDQDNGEEDEELLSPEEEEARAKAEQEEVRRQAAEAQRAKAEEEKLADIASDMILQYMVKQDGKKYKNNNAAEDKRSEEDGTNDDDLDPQTIDKLIEISSKLHLPADDVVDIISDVEKKKKKDAPENLQWQRPLIVPSAPAVPSTTFRTTPSSKPPKPNTTPLKAWFMERASVKPNKQDFWVKQKPFWTYPSYRFSQRPYSRYYPIYMPPPKPKQRYFAKPSFSLNEILGNSLDYDFNYPLKQKYRPWMKNRPRPPTIFWRNPYFPNYIVPRSQTFQAAPIPQPWSALRHRPAYYYSPPASVVTRQGDYYNQVQQPRRDSDEGLDNFIDKLLLKHPQMFQ